MDPGRDLSGAAARDERDPALDNIRFWLIVLVVVGHLPQGQARPGNVLAVVVAWIYLFHMPMFVMLSGFVTRRLPTEPQERWGLMVRLLIPYLAFDLLWSLIEARVEGGPVDVDVLEPATTLWFLLALFVWRLMLPAFARAGAWTIPASFAAGIAVGFTDRVGTYLSLSRIVVFLPFFLIGYRLGDDAPALLARRWVRIAAVVFLAAAAGGCAAVWGGIDQDWLFNSHDYSWYGVEPWQAAAVRASWYAVALIAGPAFVALVPRRRARWTAAGERTLTVYLLHYPVIYAVDRNGLLEPFDSVPEQLVLIGAAIVLAIVLSSGRLHDLITAVTQPTYLLEPVPPQVALRPPRWRVGRRAHRPAGARTAAVEGQR